MTRINLYQRLLIILLTAGLVASPLFEKSLILAQSAPTPPPAPTAPAAPTPPPEPTSPTPPPAPTYSSPTPTPSPTATPAPTSTPAPSVSPSESSTPTGDYEGLSSDGQMGDSSVETGDATTTGSGYATVNTNSALGCGSGSTCGTGSEDVWFENSGNGTNSNNDIVYTTDNDSTIIQQNDADIVNELALGSNTGGNSSSFNTGGDSTVDTGDANIIATLVTTANTNASGVYLAEFTIDENYTGDIVIDIQPPISSADTSDTSSANLTNSENGTGSDNDIAYNITDTQYLFQSNDATVDNVLNLSAETGNNTTSYNTGGDSSIKTGDVNIVANMLNLVNTNISGGGEVLFATINILNDFVGDIILPDNYFASQNQAPTNVLANTDNGADSTNTIAYTDNNTDTIFQANDADLTNNVVVDATTGDNDVRMNTNGENSIETGNVNVNVRELNIVNTNMYNTPQTMWLVIVNEMGNWIGQIFGSDGTMLASSNLSLTETPDGSVTATNSGNGSDSNNNIAITENTDTTITQTNNANVNNTVDVTANTGGNSASFNTGGNSKVNTGDVNVAANFVNFINNNIASGSKLAVAFVNVLGSWIGNIVPASEAQASQEFVSPLPSSSPTTAPAPAIRGDRASNSTSSNSVSAPVSPTTPITPIAQISPIAVAFSATPSTPPTILGAATSSNDSPPPSSTAPGSQTFFMRDLVTSSPWILLIPLSLLLVVNSSRAFATLISLTKKRRRRARHRPSTYIWTPSPNEYSL